VAAAVLALSGGMARRGHKIDIVVLDEPSASWMANTDLTVHALGSGLTSYRYSRTLLPWLRENGGDYDRVIVNGIWQYLSFAAWRRYAGSSIPYYVFPHGMLDPYSLSVKRWRKAIYLRAIERAKRHGLAAVVAVADGFNDRRRGHGLRLCCSGCGRRGWCAALERADDINLRRAGLLPREANADEQNHEANRAVKELIYEVIQPTFYFSNPPRG